MEHKQYTWLGHVWTVYLYDMLIHRCGRVTHTLDMRHAAGQIEMVLEGTQMEAFKALLTPVAGT